MSKFRDIYVIGFLSNYYVRQNSASASLPVREFSAFLPENRGRTRVVNISSGERGCK